MGGSYHMEVCMVLRGGEGGGREGIWLEGTFSTRHVYPQVLLDGGKVGRMEVDEGGRLTTLQEEVGVNSVILLGRNYEN